MPRWPWLSQVTQRTQPDSSSAALPEARPESVSEASAEACRECGLPYFRPSATQSDPVADRHLDTPAQPNAPANIETEAASWRSHLSSDPRVNTARALVKKGQFDKALAILRPLAPNHPDQTDVRFLLGLAASRGSQDTPMSGTKNGSCCWMRPSRRSGPSSFAGPDWCACAWNWPWPSI